VFVHWQTDAASAAANELMRKRKATREQGGHKSELCAAGFNSQPAMDK
jgi:hypothetical protein